MLTFCCQILLSFKWDQIKLNDLHIQGDITMISQTNWSFKLRKIKNVCCKLKFSENLYLK